MAKPPSHNLGTRSVPTVEQTSIVYPVITAAIEEECLCDEDIKRLQEASQIEFNEDGRRALRGIADAWRHHDRALRSPRPKEFDARLKRMETALERVVTLLDLGETVGGVDDQLQNWLINACFDGARDLLQLSASVSDQSGALIKLLRCARDNLPKDRGRARPKDDDRFIIYLADQFEASNGKARAYRSVHNDSGYAPTPFRNFIHLFSELLSLGSPRTENGLDEAIIRALRYRRKHLKG